MTERLSWKPWKHKKLLEEARAQQENMLYQQQQLEAERAFKEKQLREQMQREKDRYLEEVRQLQLAVDRERRLKEQQERDRLAKERDANAREELKRQETLRKQRIQKERELHQRNERARKRKMNTPEALRDLRELIRQRYELDNNVWSLRFVRRPDRPEIEKRMLQADAILAEITAIVKTWEGTEEYWTPHEWDLAREIKERLLKDNKRHWESNPPWAD